MPHNKYLNLDVCDGLVDGVVLKKLVVHKDASGSLVETIRSDWQDVISPKDPIVMQYVSTTPPGVARDENLWHVHKYQKDRFVCIEGRVVVAIFDKRANSKTKDVLNLFVMGPQNENEMYMLVIPEETYHGFLVVSKTAGTLLNFPSRLYTGKDEGRVKHTNFSWRKIKDDFGK